jgi:UTP--glucose-1-phosphate uridylyltransferase
MMQAMEQKQAEGVLAVQEVREEEVQSYGIVNADAQGKVASVIEKPKASASRLAIVGRYILPARTFQYLEQTQKGAGGEIQLTDAIAALLSEQKVYAHRFSGTRYDCGDKVGYLKANLQLGLKHSECAQEWRDYLKTLKL